MRKDEFVCDCSDIDDVIVITKEGKYIITKVSDKAFFAKNIYYIGVFKRNDERTIYNVLYRDGRTGPLMMKRCAIKGITRDREYDITKGTPKSEILYMSVNPNGEAEVLKIYFKPRPRLKKLIVDLNWRSRGVSRRATCSHAMRSTRSYSRSGALRPWPGRMSGTTTKSAGSIPTDAASCSANSSATTG